MKIKHLQDDAEPISDENSDVRLIDAIIEWCSVSDAVCITLIKFMLLLFFMQLAFQWFKNGGMAGLINVGKSVHLYDSRTRWCYNSSQCQEKSTEGRLFLSIYSGHAFLKATWSLPGANELRELFYRTAVQGALKNVLLVKGIGQTRENVTQYWSCGSHEQQAADYHAEEVYTSGLVECYSGRGCARVRQGLLIQMVVPEFNHNQFSVALDSADEVRHTTILMHQRCEAGTDAVLMKNLILGRSRQWPLPESVSSARMLASFTETDVLIYCGALSKMHQISKSLDAPLVERTICTDLDEDVAFDMTVIGMQSFANGDTSVVGRSGEIVKIANKQAELIGQIPDGILACSWSPSLDLLALVTGQNVLILMSTTDFEVVSERPVEGEAGSHFVSVGWGKKETQFHGSAGKEAARADNSVLMRPAPGDHGLPVISWRGDGQMLAVSQVDRETSARRIRVFDRQGPLQSTSELVAVLEWPLAWMPSGALIASTALHPDGRRQVIFFECNGLRHGEFFLKRQEPVQELAWNADSSVLAVHYVDGDLEFWTRQNYHWYLKRQLSDCVHFKWCPSSPSDAIVVSESGCLKIINFAWAVSRSRAMDNDKVSLVAVIDGSDILLTPFGIANISPPLSLFKWTCPDGAVPSFVACLAIPDKLEFLLCVALGCKLVLLKGAIEMLACTFEQLTETTFEEPITRITMNDDYILVQLENSHVNAYSHEMELFSTSECPKESVLSTCGNFVQHYDGQLFELNHEPLGKPNPRGFSSQLGCFKGNIIGLRDGYLSFNGQEIMSGIAYIYHTPDFVIACNAAEKTIRFLPQAMDPMQWPNLLKTSNEEISRRIEAGSEIVVASMPAASLILQAPRGNLETIYPRALVLAAVRRSLGSLDYRKAYEDCRRHRIDLNILFDHAPETFLSTADMFVEQVKKVDFLNLFVAGMREENTAASKYSGFFTTAKSELFPEKVNTICKKIREAVLSRPDSDKYWETVMTTYVCQQPPQLESALHAIIGLSQQSDFDQEALDQALGYLVFLVDPSKLYEVALGMYNLPLALSVAKKSQKDPKEYLQFLEEMAAIKLESLRRFRIDAVLGRPSKALEQYYDALTKGCEELSFEGFLEYMQQHSLYSAAIKILGKDSRLPVIYSMFAKACRESGDLEAAASLYRLAKDKVNALEVTVEAGMWQVAVDLVPQDEVVFGRLFNTLMDQRRYVEAYNFASAHGLDSEKVLDAALAGCLWNEALAIAGVDKEAVVDEVIKAADHLESDLDDIRKVFEEKAARLMLLQSQILNPPASTADAGIVEISDAVSEMTFKSGATTMFTKSTTLSGATSVRNRKRAERNLMKARPGTPFERDGLRLIITEKIEAVKKIHASIRLLLVILAEHGEMSQASALQASLLELTKSIADFSIAFKALQAKIEVKQVLELSSQTLPEQFFTSEVVSGEIVSANAWHTAFTLSSDFGKCQWTLPYL